MKFAEYNLKFRFVNKANLPVFKGSTFRGIFGHALKKVVCALKHQECRACILKLKTLTRFEGIATGRLSGGKREEGGGIRDF